MSIKRLFTFFSWSAIFRQSLHIVRLPFFNCYATISSVLPHLLHRHRYFLSPKYFCTYKSPNVCPVMSTNFTILAPSYLIKITLNISLFYTMIITILSISLTSYHNALCFHQYMSQLQIHPPHGVENHISMLQHPQFEVYV